MQVNLFIIIFSSTNKYGKSLFLYHLEVLRLLLPDLESDGRGQGGGVAEEEADHQDLDRIDGAQETGGK